MRTYENPVQRGFFPDPSVVRVGDEPKIRDAALVVVFCARESIDGGYIEELLAREQTDGRFSSEKAMDSQRSSKTYFVDRHRFELKDARQWMEKQVYIAVGTLLSGAAFLKLDACPMEGFDNRLLDEALDIRKDGYSSSVVVALGYHSNDDFNAALPKSRRPKDEVIVRI